MGKGASGGAIIEGAMMAKALDKQAKAQKQLATKMEDDQYAMAEEGRAYRETLSERTLAEGQLATQQRRAAEEAQINVFGSLGMAGTYDMPGDTPGGPLTSLAPGGLKPLQTGGILSSGEDFLKSGIVRPEDVAMRGPKGEAGGKKGQQGAGKSGATWSGHGKKWEVEGQVMDPDAMAQQIKSTSGFRQVSRLVAESEQLLNRKGRLWEEMNNSIVGGIYESSAAFQKQAMEELSRDMARGGNARNRAMANAQKYQIQEGINRQRTGALWQSKMGMEQWIRSNAAATQNFAMAWTQNQSGIRDTFTASLTNLATFWSQTAMPALMGTSIQSQTSTMEGVGRAAEMFNQAIQSKTAATAAKAAAVKGGVAMAGQIASGPAGAGGGGQ